jgi:hypothetical protein
LGGGDGRDCGQVPATGKDSEAAEERLLRGGEQVVGPGDGVAKRLLAARSLPAGGGDIERLVETTQQRLGAEQPHAGGRQFDGQRQPIQTAADRDDLRDVFSRQQEIGMDTAGLLDEKLHSPGIFRIRDDRVLGERQRWHRLPMFCRHRKRPARSG